MKKIKAAVTGNIGSGKSSFCNFLEQMKYKVISADDIAKNILVNDEKIKKKIINEFGALAYTKNELNTKYLADNVFSDPILVNKINSIVHPAVIKEVNSLMEKELRNSDIVFHEAALIYEAKMENLFDYVVLISSDLNMRMNRKMKNDNFSEEEFMKRELNQIPEDEKKKQADFVFINNGSLNELKMKAELLVKILRSIKE